MRNQGDDTPAAPPPDGQTSNLINPPYNGYVVLVINVVFMSLALFAFIIRFYAQIILTRNWGWDDFVCSLAVFGTISRTIFTYYQVKIGLGRHMWDIPRSWLLKPGVEQLLNANRVAYPLVLFFVKLSILLFYFRIFGVSRKLRLIIHITIATITLFYAIILGLGIVGMFQCTEPLKELTYFCGVLENQSITTTATFNFISDVWTLSLPFPLIFKLQLRLKDKVGLAMVFAWGFAACGASLARLIIQGMFYGTTDTLWYKSYNIICATIETNILIIVACVPCFPVFYRHMKPHLSSATSTLRRRFVSGGRSSETPSGKGFPVDSSAKKVPEQFHVMPEDRGHVYIELHEPSASWEHTACSRREHV